eukprot:PhF_6_TR30380/c0_g1_i3/m.44517
MSRNLTSVSDDVFCLFLTFLPLRDVCSDNGKKYIPGPTLRLNRHTYFNLSQQRSFWEFMISNLSKQRYYFQHTVKQEIDDGASTLQSYVRMRLPRWTIVRACTEMEHAPNTSIEVTHNATQIVQSSETFVSFALCGLDLRHPPNGGRFVDIVLKAKQHELAMNRFIVGITQHGESWDGKSAPDRKRSVYGETVWGTFMANTTGAKNSGYVPECCDELTMKIDTEAKALHFLIPDETVVLGNVSYSFFEDNVPIHVFIGMLRYTLTMRVMTNANPV